MPASRDDFRIAIRSALLQKGAAQKFSLVSLIIVALIIFFLDVYNIGLIKPVRTFINDGVYRASVVASTPTKYVPRLFGNISELFKTKKENSRLRNELEFYKSKEYKVEYLTNQNKALQQFLGNIKENNEDTKSIIVAKVLLDKGSPYLKSVIINRGTKSGILLGLSLIHI